MGEELFNGKEYNFLKAQNTGIPCQEKRSDKVGVERLEYE